MKKKIGAGLLAFALAGCGGGGSSDSSSSSTSPPVTQAPQSAGVFVQPTSYVPTPTPTAMVATVRTAISAATSAATSATLPTYDPASGNVNLPTVSVNGTMYGQASLHYNGDGSFSVTKMPVVDTTDTITASAYTNGDLVLKSVMVGTHRYTNATLHLDTTGKFILVSVNDPALVQKSSYLNAKNINMPSQSLPMVIQHGTYFATLNAYAYGDFFQDGTESVVASGTTYDPTKPISAMTPGVIKFWKKDASGNWTDHTSDVLKDSTGCYHARKAVIADFNGDGIPDVYFACTGYDGTPQPGEQQRILLSQPDGTYKNVLLPTTGFIHSASAADFKGNGFADILVTNNNSAGPFFLRNNGDGTFTEDHSSLPAYIQNGTYGGHAGWPIFTAELVDVDGDGKVDVFLAGNAVNTDTNLNFAPTFVLGDGTGKFANGQMVTMPLEGDQFNLTLDVVVANGNVYLLNVPGLSGPSFYNGEAIQRVSFKTLATTTLFTHTGYVDQANNLVWDDWIIPYNGQIVSEATQYALSVQQ